MTVRMRFGLDGLATVLDLEPGVTVVSAEVSGGFLDVELDGVSEPAVAHGDEVTAEYVVTVDASGRPRRHFERFKLPDGPPDAALGDTAEDAIAAAALAQTSAEVGTEETTPPSGRGSRGAKGGSS